MKNEIKEYLLDVEAEAGKTDVDKKKLAGTLEKRILFYQHERLVHLIVTMTFALLTLISFAAAYFNIAFVAVAVLFLALEIPYIAHYYFLENSVQKLQRIYFKLNENKTED